MSAEARTGRVDSWSLWAPLVCGVHCLLAPALALAAPAFAAVERVETVVMIVAATMGAVALRSGARVHRRAGPWWLAGAGMLLWVVSRQAGLPLPEWLVAGAGGLLVFSGLFWNSRLRAHRCECPACATHD